MGVKTKVKVCGITDLGDAHLAVDLGAWALGLILWQGSPRVCPPERAEEISATLRRRVEIAGVFVNATLEEVALAADRYWLSLLQLHGDEGPAYCREAARRTGARVIKAARVKDSSSVRSLGAFHVDFHLLDAYVPAQRGGTGETFEWDLTKDAGRIAPVILSGGIRPDNVSAAISSVAPYAVDTASGTEATPGRKDATLLRAFFDAIRATEPAPEPKREDDTAERAASA